MQVHVAIVNVVMYLCKSCNKNSLSCCGHTQIANSFTYRLRKHGAACAPLLWTHRGGTSGVHIAHDLARAYAFALVKLRLRLVGKSFRSLRMEFTCIRMGQVTKPAASSCPREAITSSGSSAFYFLVPIICSYRLQIQE